MDEFELIKLMAECGEFVVDCLRGGVCDTWTNGVGVLLMFFGVVHFSPACAGLARLVAVL